MRSLVTGGAGFIGSHVVDALLRRGDEVIVLDDLSTGRAENLVRALDRGALLVEASLTDADLLDARMREHAPERIFHLAAQVDVRKAVADPAWDADVNVLGTINLLEAVRRIGGASVVFASTGGAIYGEGCDRMLPFVESSAADPETAYGVSKFAAEAYVGYYRRLHGLPAVGLRFGNVYGPRQDPRGEAGVVAIFCGLLREGTPLTVFGDGEQTRDYVYVADVVQAVLAADRTLESRGVGLAGPYNVGTGTETKVNELALMMGEIVDAEVTINYMPERRGEVRRVAIDPRAAERDLGWRAATELRDGLRETYAALDGV